MRFHRQIRLLTSLLALSVVVGTRADDAAVPKSGQKKPATASEEKAPAEKVIKTDAQWRRILTADQYWVTRQKGTEPAWSGKYAQGHFQGTFTCVCCGAELFSSRHKFESGTGWPSFYQPIVATALDTATDTDMAPEIRVEVMCHRCGAHLGHVFDDGPPPTGLRYCINSVALKLQPVPSAKASTANRPKTSVRPSTTGRDLKEPEPENSEGRAH